MYKKTGKKRGRKKKSENLTNKELLSRAIGGIKNNRAEVVKLRGRLQGEVDSLLDTITDLDGIIGYCDDAIDDELDVRIK